MKTNIDIGKQAVCTDLSYSEDSSDPHLIVSTDCGRAERFSLCKAIFQRAALSNVSISAICHPDGTVFPHPTGLDDEVLNELFTSGQLVGQPLHEIVKNSVNVLINETPGNSLKELTILESQLEEAIKTVRGFIAELESSYVSVTHQ